MLRAPSIPSWNQPGSRSLDRSSASRSIQSARRPDNQIWPDMSDYCRTWSRSEHAPRAACFAYCLSRPATVIVHRVSFRPYRARIPKSASCWSTWGVPSWRDCAGRYRRARYRAGWHHVTFYVGDNGDPAPRQCLGAARGPKVRNQHLEFQRSAMRRCGDPQPREAACF